MRRLYEGNFENTEVLETIKPVYDHDNSGEVIDVSSIICAFKKQWRIYFLSIVVFSYWPEAVIDGFENYYANCYSKFPIIAIKAFAKVAVYMKQK